MLTKVIKVLVFASLLALSGCSSVSEEYKPLYQVKPEKHMIEGRL